MAGWKMLGSAVVALVAVTQVAYAADARREAPVRLPDGTQVDVVTLSNARGVSARVLSYGATLQSLSFPDRNGVPSDVTLGYDDPADYQRLPNYFGVTVGRYANRIGGGTLTIAGRPVQLSQNDGGNSLHGGVQGFDKRNWRVVSVSSGPVARLVLALTSPAGDQGYPGKLEVKVTYTLDDAGDLGILFEAATDAPTVVNMTNHALFNLAGQETPVDAMRHWLQMPASRYTPVDTRLIPTGELRTVAGTAFDFREPRLVEQGLRDGRDEQIVIGRGYDHNWALDKGQTAQPELAARLADPASGRVLDVLTTEPGVQFYSGNFLTGTVKGKGGKVYRMGDGIALEPQKFPDTPNKPAFGSALVEPGKPYRHQMIYRVYTMPAPQAGAAK